MVGNVVINPDPVIKTLSVTFGIEKQRADVSVLVTSNEGAL